MGGLTEEHRSSWNNNGFLVFPEFVDQQSLACLNTQIDALVAGFASHLSPQSTTIFSTTEQSHAQDEWFLSSGATIRPFFEDGAFDADGKLCVPFAEALNKIGHAMHDLDPTFDHFSRTPDLANLVSQLGVADPLLLQSMIIFKPPRIGGEVACHTDHTFLWTDPPSVIGLWFALDDATVDNGCLWVLPSGHTKPVRSRSRLTASGTVTEVLDPTPYDMKQLVPVEVKAGTLVAFSGLLPHWSAPNKSTTARRAYTLHIIDGTTQYAADNWLQRPRDLPFRGFS